MEGHFRAIFNSSETRCPPFKESGIRFGQVLSLNFGDFLGIMGLDLQHFGPIWRFVAFLEVLNLGPG